MQVWRTGFLLCRRKFVVLQRLWRSCFFNPNHDFWVLCCCPLKMRRQLLLCFYSGWRVVFTVRVIFKSQLRWIEKWPFKHDSRFTEDLSTALCWSSGSSFSHRLCQSFPTWGTCTPRGSGVWARGGKLCWRGPIGHRLGMQQLVRRNSHSLHYIYMGISLRMFATLTCKSSCTPGSWWIAHSTTS